MIKWTVSKSVTSDPLVANIFPLDLVWSKGELQGIRPLELPASIMKSKPLSGSLIKSKSGENDPSSSKSGLTLFLLCGEQKSGGQLAA